MTVVCFIIAATFSVYNFGAKALAQGGGKWAVRRDVRMAASFITKEVRNATNLDLISSSGSSETGYSYIYLNGNTIKHVNQSGTVIEKTNVNINSLSFICSNVSGKNVLRFTINGGTDPYVYEISSDVLLNNISGKNPSAGYVIRYNASDFVARAGDGQVSFSFPACSGATSVQLLKSATSSSEGFTDSGVSLSVNSTSATVTGLVNGTQYWFKLVVTGGSRAGSYLVIAKPEVPSEPVNDLAAIAGIGQVSFTFSAPTGASAVQLQKSTASATAGFTDTGASLDASSTSATVADLTNGTQYWFKLFVTGGTRAGESTVVTATPTTVPITDLSATASDSQVSFTFSAPAGASAVQLQQSTTSATAGFTDTGISLNASSTSATVSDLTNGAQYWFKLVVIGGSRAGDSNVVTAIPSSPVSDLAVASVESTQASFTFSAPTGAATVKLYKSTTSASSGFTDTGVVLNAGSTSATVTGLSTGAQYWFKLMVTGGARAGDSNVVTATPAGPIADLAVNSIGNKQVSFTFSAPTGATTVKLYKSTTSASSGFTDTGAALNAGSTSATATGLSRRTKYWFKLVVTGGARAGDSNVVTATTT